MSSQSLEAIGVRGALLRALERKARNEGKTPREYIRLLIERDLLADKSFDEILGPIRDDFRRSGITEEQLDELVERARNASRPKATKARK